MKQISISITYETADSRYKCPILQISDAKDHFPNNLELTEIIYEKEWIEGKTRITLKGVYK